MENVHTVPVARLYIIGIGIFPDYLTVRAIEVLRKVSHIFLECYTSALPIDELKKVLYEHVGEKALEILTRKDIEEDNCIKILKRLDSGQDVALLVPGDPMIATTHSYIRVLVRKKGHEVVIIHGVSILNSVISFLGLSPYRFGPVATVTYPRMGVYSERPYDVTKDNLARNLHTILLLDIRDDGGFMTVLEAVEILRELEKRRREGVFVEDRVIIGVARLGYPDQRVCIMRLRDADKASGLGDPPHTVVVPARLAEYEAEVLMHDLGLDPELVKELLQ